MTAPASLWKILFEDGERRTVLMRYAPGAVIPRHRHVGDEQIFVLEGSVSDNPRCAVRAAHSSSP